MLDRRRHPRLAMQLPIRVQGRDEPWEEMTQSGDVSLGGASFTLRRRVKAGECLHLALPLPKRLRRYDLVEPAYRVWAIVRYVEQGGSARRIGVLFIGRRPAQHVAVAPTSGRRERRAHERSTLFVNLRLRQNGMAELTVSENLCRGGLLCPTTLPLRRGEIVLVEELDGDFRCRAEVRSVRSGADNVSRVGLRFLDAQAPVRLVPPR